MRTRSHEPYSKGHFRHTAKVTFRQSQNTVIVCLLKIQFAVIKSHLRRCRTCFRGALSHAPALCCHIFPACCHISPACCHNPKSGWDGGRWGFFACRWPRCSIYCFPHPFQTAPGHHLGRIAVKFRSFFVAGWLKASRAKNLFRSFSPMHPVYSSHTGAANTGSAVQPVSPWSPVYVEPVSPLAAITDSAVQPVSPYVQPVSPLAAITDSAPPAWSPVYVQPVSPLAAITDSAVQPVPPPPPAAKTDSAVQPFSPPAGPAIPIFEVAFDSGMWWSIPPALSQELYDKYMTGGDASYTCEKRSYVLDFETMEQRNIANDRRRSIRLIWVCPEEVTPCWTGQIPKS